MDRRKFLSLFSAGVAGIALEQAIPLGRVWSFPKKIVIADPLLDEWGNRLLYADWISLETLRILKSHLRCTSYFNTDWEKDFKHEFAVGGVVKVKPPRDFTAAFPPDSSHTPS